MTRKLSTLLASITLCLCAAPSSAQGGAVIVTVDGLSFTNTILDWPFEMDDMDDYLLDALAGMELSFQPQIYSFPWSRDAFDTVEEVDNLKQFIEAKHALADSQDKFILVSHSWGTFLSYAALDGLCQDGSPVHCDLYITLGSQKSAGQTTSSITAWIWSSRGWLSGASIPGIGQASAEAGCRES